MGSVGFSSVQFSWDLTDQITAWPLQFCIFLKTVAKEKKPSVYDIWEHTLFADPEGITSTSPPVSVACRGHTHSAKEPCNRPQARRSREEDTSNVLLMQWQEINEVKLYSDDPSGGGCFVLQRTVRNPRGACHYDQGKSPFLAIR